MPKIEQSFWMVTLSLVSFASAARAQCDFPVGPETERWADLAQFSSASGSNGVDVNAAVGWLESHATTVLLPPGAGMMVSWFDGQLQRDVAYCSTDNLWAAHALKPYNQGLADVLKNTLIGVGRYGNRLHDSLFHFVGTLEFESTDDDSAHGELLGTCQRQGGSAVDVRAFDFRQNDALSRDLPNMFIDSAVYSALQLLWGGSVDAARGRIDDVIARSSDDDTMFWDPQRRVLVDVATRGDYDDGNSSYTNATFKLGLMLYAMRLLNAGDSGVISAMRARVGEAQLDDGGIAHDVTYGENADPTRFGGPTGEATSIAVMSFSVNPAL